MIIRQRENFEEKSGGFGRCPIVDDVIVEPELQEVKCEDLVKKFNNLKERKNELRSLILKGLEDEPQDNILLSLMIEFDYEFGAPTRDDDEEVGTPVQSARRDDVMQSPVPFDLSPTLLEEVIKSCKNIEAKKEMENKEKSLMPSFDLKISQDEFSSLSDKSLKDLININYPLFKRGLEEDMKHDVVIQDFQKVDLKYLFIRYLESVGHKMADPLRKCKVMALDFEWKTKENVVDCGWNPKTPIWDMLESTLTYQYKKYAEAIKQTIAKPVAS
ncbi:hypothetical protein L2E82_06419 [Cichorium intybus]|uniref:Uncharacterized protein n=1 Tax=Cichorium intybus TaxID=13427 RepID=A0ACB9HC72_CICIN|nr:hypothetical protein L2E82_06419 [Cichorium intybus]